MSELWPVLEVRVPRDGEERPGLTLDVPPLRDTRGGPWRAAHRPQDPAKDPAEPSGGESASTGSDHAWAGCTMSAGAVAYAYESHYAGGSAAPWGGHLRHSGQPDMEGGTDLGDLRDAWRLLGGFDLGIRSGSGWAALTAAHEEGRAIVVQGTGTCPGSGYFTGAHACCIGPETRSDGAWLWSDPVTSGWQWVTPGSIRGWMERLQASLLYAVSRAPEVDMPPFAIRYPGGGRYGTVSVRPGATVYRTIDSGEVTVGSDGSSGPGCSAMHDVSGGSPGFAYTSSETGATFWARAGDASIEETGGGSSEDPEAIRRERDALWVDSLTQDWPVPVEPV